MPTSTQRRLQTISTAISPHGKRNRVESNRGSRETVEGQVYKANQIYRMAFEHCASHEKEWQVARHELLSFIDGFSGYNQIKIAEADTHKTAFRCPHELLRGVEVNKNKAKAIMKANPPRNKKELQRFLGQVNYLRGFISNLAGKEKEFSQLLKLKDSREFKWEDSHQKSFDVIKRYLSNPPVLMPPRYGMPLKLYISAAHESIGCLLVQNNHERNEHAIYYLNRFLTLVEVKYFVIEKLCLTLYYACTKLRHYLIQSRVLVVSKTDLIKYMLNRLILSGRIGKWSLALTEFTLIYYPQKSVKGQAIADFLADHPSPDEFIGEKVGFPVCGVGVQPWGLKFDGSSTETAAGAGIVITSPRGMKIALSFNLGFPCTNNQAEYEALIIGLEILKYLWAKELLISGDSQLVLKQLSGEFKCTSLSLASYYTAASQLLDDFEEVSLLHVPRQENLEADELAQVASGLKMSQELTHRLVLIQKKHNPSIQQRGIQVDTLNLDINLAGDWRDDIKQVLESTGRDIPHGLKMRALNYVLVEGDLYRKGLDGLLLRCIGFPEALEIMKQIHEGVCGAHQSGVKMR
ncbi:uncharacterized protein LOC142537713 [Primulina tabacum]|uniref:uncharacterized protein LOC142537713 n=1 Tax=Primulina tabacum TaxID=48773 RepID=UPI003F5A8708